MSLEPNAIALTRLRERAAATPLQIDSWEPLAAAQGFGSLLFGPHDHGAQAVVPPGVLVRSPRGCERECSEHGWRIAIWDRRDESGCVEGGRPKRLTQVTVEDVVALVRREAPKHEAWLVAQVDQRILCLSVLIEHADSGEERQLAGWRAERDELLLDATRAFGEPWVRGTVAHAPR